MEEKLTPAEKTELFRATASSEEARAAFAESWAAMINEVLPIETTVRSIFAIERLAPGAVPIYTSDVQPINAWYLPKFGQHPINIVEVEEVSVSTFELVGNVSWKLRDAKHGRIDIPNRALQRMVDSMVTLEETAGWDVLEAAVTTALTVTGATSAGFSKELIDDAFAAMEGNRDHQVTDIYVGPAAMANIRGWTQTTIDPVTQREIFVNAGMPSIYGAQIHIVHFLPTSAAYFLDTRTTVPNPLGYMPIREELQTFDDPTAIKSFRAGVVCYEEIGFVVMNGTRIVKATLV